jgi:hypothetical protein
LRDTLSLHTCNSIFGNYRQRKTLIFSVHVDANDTTANLLRFILKKLKFDCITIIEDVEILQLFYQQYLLVGWLEEQFERLEFPFTYFFRNKRCRNEMALK